MGGARGGAQVDVGDVLEGRYELLRAWSAGGRGAIWLARVRGSHGFAKLFALKMPLPELAEDEELCAMFIDEARIIAQIRHGNVVGVEHLGDHLGVPFLALEWIQGTSWLALIDACREAGDVPTDVMLRIAAGACAGLHAAHELRGENGEALDVVHRDVSPQNVLVTEAGTTKIIDFGIAKARGRLSEKTRVGVIKAKLEFAAPEQLGFRRVDRRADVWGLGVVLFLIFVGRLPFEAPKGMSLMATIAKGLTEPLPEHVPSSIGDIITRALQVDPKDRFQTAAEMKAAIEACITSPTPPEAVASCVKQRLGHNLAARRQAVRLALEEADRRAELEDIERPAQSSKPGSAEQRVLMPTQPPEVTQRAWEDALDPADPADRATQSSTPPALAAPRMTTFAWVAVAASTLLALGIWGEVLALGRVPRTPRAPSEQRP